MRNIFKFFIPFVLMSFTFTSGAWARDIYVRLSEKSQLAVRSDAAMTLTDAAKKTFSLGKSATLSRSGSSVVAGKRKFQLPARISTGGLLGFNNRDYRGEFLLTREFVLINVVDVEDYIQGVLPAEGIASWPKEYQRAQAIISRTYGLRQSLSRSSRGYDVADDVSSQVYKGAGAETAATNQAVKDTAGEVVAYGDSLAFTPFHSDSGGYTATNSHVWGSDVPYLKGVKEAVAYDSPNSSWTAKIPASKVQAALSKIDRGVGNVKEVRITEFDAGGRASKLTFVGSGGSVTVNSSAFRTAVGSNTLKSTFLTGGAPMAPAAPQPRPSPAPKPAAPQTAAPANRRNTSPAPPVPTSSTPLSSREETRLTRMTSEGLFTAAELLDMLTNPDKRKGYLYLGIQRNGDAPQPEAEVQKKPQAPLPKAMPDAAMPVLKPTEVIHEENGYFVFHGRGWGHGVGLSQWGAMAMAKAGWTAERILEHYYPGTAVKRIK